MQWRPNCLAAWCSRIALTVVRLVGRDGVCRGKARRLKTLAIQLLKDDAFRRCTFRQGTRRDLSALFARVRVQVNDDEPVTLLIEWRDHEPERANYFFIWMAKIPPATKQLVRLVMQRWRTERAYQDLKGELGFSPRRPEGRWWPRRTASRPERHFPDSFITVRLAAARMIARWLPRCPACHRWRTKAQRVRE